MYMYTLHACCTRVHFTYVCKFFPCLVMSLIMSWFNAIFKMSITVSFAAFIVVGIRMFTKHSCNNSHSIQQPRMYNSIMNML